MANVIKYIYTSVPENTVKTYPFVIGVNFGGYGSTAATGYWNGKTPNVGGYVVYVSVSPPSSPTIYVADNDAQLISLCNQLFGSNVTTVEAALQTFNGSTSTCCVNMDYPNIVTTNIGPNLDAGYTPSYSRSGTTWSDISGSGYTSTLVNGVSYGSGALTFDGTDDAVTLPSTITLGNGNWSVCMWVSAGSFNADYGKLLSNNSGGPVTNAMGVTNGKISYQYYLSSWSEQLGSTSLTAGNWYYLTWVNSSPGKMLMYVNGVVDCALFTSTTNNGGPVNSIGRNWFSTFPGKISTVSIYQGKSLTDQEILQNYYAGFQRFIPTGGLVLYLDGNNTNKQVMTASTANDISGNNNTGTLINGVTLARDGQRSFSFDGVDDYISLNNAVLSTMSDDNSLTVSMFVNINEASLSTRGGLLCNQKYSSESDAGGFGFVIENGGLIGVNLTKNISSVQTSYEVISSFSMNRQQFALYTFTYNSSTKTVITYKNGVQQATSTNASYGWTKNTTSRSTLIGVNTQGGWGAYYKMIIGQVRVHNTVLSAANILTLYTATKSRYGL